MNKLSSPRLLLVAVTKRQGTARGALTVEDANLTFPHAAETCAV